MNNLNEAVFKNYLTLSNEEKEKNIKIAMKMFPTWSVKIKKNNDDILRLISKNCKDNCMNYSFDTWIRLYKIGAKRIRAQVINEAFTYNPNKESIVFHYWVETNKFVFTENAFCTMIIPREEYYTFNKIINIEIAENGIFTTFNKLLNIERDENEMRLKHKNFLKTQK